MYNDVYLYCRKCTYVEYRNTEKLYGYITMNKVKFDLST